MRCSRPWNRFRPGRDHGFSLIELMVVVTLISILLGIGSALFTHAHRKLALNVAAAETVTLLKQARYFSMQESERSVILLTPETMELWGYRPVGFWHLEDMVSHGAFGKNATPKNLETAAGKVGRSLQFKGENSSLECGKFGQFNLGDGFSLSFWVYPERAKDSQSLFQISHYYILGVNPDYTLALKAFDQKTNTSLLYPLPLYQWTHLYLADHGNSISVLADDVLLAQLSYRRSRIPQDAPLLLGNGFKGKMDEVKLCARVALETLWLPEDIVFRKAPERIVFDRHGALDVSNGISSLTMLLEKQSAQECIMVSLSSFGIVSVSEPPKKEQK